MLPEQLQRELPHDFSLAIRTNLKNHHKAYQIMDMFHHKGVCLTLNKTADNLRRLLNNSGMDSSKIHIIDPLTKAISSPVEAQDTTHIPYNLHHMLETTEKVLQQLPLKQRFMVIDGIHSLPLVYTDETVQSFLKNFHTTLRRHHTHAIYLYDRDKLHEPLKSAVHKLVDKVIEMT
jgi:hypothetical protein